MRSSAEGGSGPQFRPLRAYLASESVFSVGSKLHEADRASFG